MTLGELQGASQGPLCDWAAITLRCSCWPQNTNSKWSPSFAIVTIGLLPFATVVTSVQDEHAVRQYHALLQQLVELRAQLRALLNAPQACLPFLQPGAERRRGCVACICPGNLTLTKALAARSCFVCRG